MLRTVWICAEQLGPFLKPCGNDIKAFNGRGGEVGRKEKKTLRYQERKPGSLLRTGTEQRVKRLLQDCLTFEESINSSE